MANNSKAALPAPHKEILSGLSEHGGSLTVTYYFDRKYVPVEKSLASRFIIHEYDDNGKSVYRSYGIIGEELPGEFDYMDPASPVNKFARERTPRELAARRELGLREGQSKEFKPRDNKDRPKKPEAAKDGRPKQGAQKIAPPKQAPAKPGPPKQVPAKQAPPKLGQPKLPRREEAPKAEGGGVNRPRQQQRPRPRFKRDDQGPEGQGRPSGPNPGNGE